MKHCDEFFNDMFSQSSLKPRRKLRNTLDDLLMVLRRLTVACGKTASCNKPTFFSFTIQMVKTNWFIHRVTLLRKALFTET